MTKLDWKNRHVLVTGAGGFIGSQLVEALASRGARVRAFLRYTADQDEGNLAYLPTQLKSSVESFFGDIRDFQAVEAAMERIDTVFHLAAAISIPYSILHPVEVVEVNAVGTLNLLEAVRKKPAHVRRAVFTSTSEVYGSAVQIPMSEAHPKSPQSPYAASKIAADAIAQSYAKSYALPIVILRPFNTFGPRQSDRAVIPTIIAQALWRDAIQLGDRRPKRDFTYVSDTVEGFLRAATLPKAIGETVHLGTGRSVSIQFIVDTVQKILGTKKPVVSKAQRLRPHKSEVTQLISNPARAKRILGWTPSISLEEGLRLTIEWIRSHRASYLPDQYRI